MAVETAQTPDNSPCRARSRSRSKTRCPIEPDSIKFGPSGYDFSKPDPMPKSAQHRVQELLESGRLFRYQGHTDVADLEKEFSEYIGLPYTMACNSGGCGIFLALKALGAKPGVKVLVNAWTLAPVPGAVVHVGATPVFVASDGEGLCIDVEDLESKAVESGAKILLLSYMRGQVPNMDRVMEVVNRYGLLVIEDCAHTLGAKWKLEGEEEHRHLGTFGAAAVWSLQTNKSINSGEGGLISTARKDVAGYITIATGSYGHFGLNGASPDTDYMKEIYTGVPNMSMRMSTLVAAMARPQLVELPGKLDQFRRHALHIREKFAACPHIRIVTKPYHDSGKEIIMWSSIQFELMRFSDEMIRKAVDELAGMGIPLAWFGAPWKGFTSTLVDWKFAHPDGDEHPSSHMSSIASIKKLTKALLDIPLYHTASWGDSVIAKLADSIISVVTIVADSTDSFEDLN